MIYATAAADHYIPIRNLSTTHKHYTTNNDLCSTAKDTCETCRSLPTTTDLSKIPGKTYGTLGSLSSTAAHPF